MSDIYASRLGPPPPLPLQVALAASGDGGHSWQQTTLARPNRLQASLLAPGVTMDAAGHCYAATSLPNATDGAPTVTFWRADPGSAAPADAVMRMQEHTLIQASVAAVGVSERLFAVAETYQSFEQQASICQGDVCPPAPPLATSHLIWAPLP